ncbi:MAG: 16S rRNA (adenine(1518)-N(6)/adenine(1519)-N(6))-dimethyltransferase RsmA [Candidatus Omnitrophica bacterium]|nr:16S rRNA (adenine(1518)-N(6)/adenine(1519)-N(6))-dimethyltransferase RsmA [Candidatus Omnitrophota bacterium]
MRARLRDDFTSARFRQMTLSEIKRILAEGGIQPAKSLGQHFLHDANQVRRILEAAELDSKDRVLEIGPGLGALTEGLAARAGRVLAIEKDDRLFAWLEDHFAGAKNLSLRHGDALEVLQHEPIDWTGWKLVSNLPYSVTSSILLQLSASSNCPRRMVIALQLEVVQRLLAAPGDFDYGVLTLLIQLRYRVNRVFRITARCFFPEPKVDSAVLVLERREEALLSERLAVVFARIVRRSFSQRRKIMLKLLKEDWPGEQLIGAFDRLGLPYQVRAEAVSLDQFVSLTRMLPILRIQPSPDNPATK